ncbi:MAG: methylmalonyl-CoA mutase, partial [Chloroflexi bacterium]|nr:methylmalonyl-CoA mutase [Chloroflexota bacterium]
YSGNCGTSLVKEQYLNNIVRGGLACLAGVLGGVQICDVRPYDEYFGIPTEESLRTALRTQQVVYYETGVTDTVDPLAGSYYVETLTLEFEERVWKAVEEIERRGGVVKCIEDGYLRRLMAEDAYQWYKRSERGDILRVGANCFPSKEDERPFKIMRADPRVEEERITSVQELKRKRDSRKAERSLSELRGAAVAAATPANNLMEPVLEAVKAYATVGEMCDVLRGVWGEYKEPQVV